MKKIIFALCLFCFPAFAWNGVDVDNGDKIEIHKGNLVRTGLTINIYDVATEQEKPATVEFIKGRDDFVELRVRYNNGTSHTYQMEKHQPRHKRKRK